MHNEWQNITKASMILQWRHNESDGVANHQPHNCFLNRLFRHTSRKTSKLRVHGICEANSPVTGEFSARNASNTENGSIWWRHHKVISGQRSTLASRHLWRVQVDMLIVKYIWIDVENHYHLCFKLVTWNLYWDNAYLRWLSKMFNCV